ncbi:MAG: twin-arginine translocase subunit TatC [Nitrososphaerales archaeon]
MPEPPPPNKPKDEPDDRGGGTLSGGWRDMLGHLQELSGRLRKSLIAFIIAFVVVSSLPDPVQPFGGPSSFMGYNFFLISLVNRAKVAYVPSGYSFLATGLTDPIFVFLNVSMVVAVLVSMPYIFTQIYAFVAPGLYARERRAVRKYVLPFTLLMVAGGLFGLFVVFPTIIRILVDFFPLFDTAPLLSLDSFVNLLLLIPFLTGLAFTFPVFIVPLVEIRLISVKQLTSARKWVYVLVALAVGIVDPDPTFISVIPIIVPVYILYEITIFVSKRIESQRFKRQNS